MNHKGTHNMARFETIFGWWVVKHRWWIISATVIVAFAASSGIRFLTVNNDTRVFLYVSTYSLSRAHYTVRQCVHKNHSLAY